MRVNEITVVHEFASALDDGNYEALAGLLAENCEYQTNHGSITGQEAIVASYRSHDEWARTHIERVLYESSVRLEEDHAIVTFIDKLEHHGRAHTYACEQLVYVDLGLIHRIVHREIEGQRQSVDLFLQGIGLGT